MSALSAVGPVWLVGAGNMGGAMLRGWISAGIDPTRITVIDPFAADLPAGVTGVAAPAADAPPPSIAVLAVKPQLLEQVVLALAPLLGSDTLLVSILAGTEIASLRAAFPAPRAVLRIMPNLPVMIGRGVMALHGVGLDDAARSLAEALSAPLGRVEWIAEEAQFDAVTALSGSGPAFLFAFADALAKGGAALGLPADQALRLALATVEGSAVMAAQSDEPPSVLADRVTSKGGTTRAGRDILEADDALDRLVAATLAAAEQRGRELAEAARGA